MKSRKPITVSMTIIVTLAALGGMTRAAQDKYSVKVPNGLAFSEFRDTNPAGRVDAARMGQRSQRSWQTRT